MALKNGSTPASHFGKQVRKERQRKGWTLADLERETGISAPHLSRIERGLAAPTERVASAMDKAFPRRDGWFMEYATDVQHWAPPGYKLLGPYEDAATHLWLWCPGVVNGMAQTEAYARALLATFPDATPERLAARVQARMERQKRVLHRESPPSIWLLIDEVALFRMVGASPEIMAAQMDHLLAVAALPHVTMQVVPTLGHPVTGSELVVTDSAAYAEHAGHGYTYTDSETATDLGRLITRIQAESYRESESIHMVERVKELWATTTTGASLLTRLLTEGRA